MKNLVVLFLIFFMSSCSGIYVTGYNTEPKVRYYQYNGPVYYPIHRSINYPRYQHIQYQIPQHIQYPIRYFSLPRPRR